MPDVGRRLEDSPGAALLTEILQANRAVRERHDTLEFINHAYLRHQVRLVVNVGGHNPDGDDGLPGADRVGLPVGHSEPLRDRWGQLIIPLTQLDRHSRATTHVVNESGEIVPLLTADEQHHLLGGGLVAYAAQALGRQPVSDLATLLREIPGRAALALEPASTDARVATDKIFDGLSVEILARQDGIDVLRSFQFRSALRVAAASEQLIVAIPPNAVPTRVLTYEFMRPLPHRPRGFWSRLWVKFRHAGTVRANVFLGPIGNCSGYQLDADAPFDTWFHQAKLLTTVGIDDPSRPREDDVDTTMLYRLQTRRRSRSDYAYGQLQVSLRCVFSGVARASVFASAFLAVCCLLGTLRVVLADDHTFLDSDVDAGASLLLLFPGIVASFLATPARHTLTAQMQFPLRLVLWAMSAGSFALAVATAIRVSGRLNILLWGATSLMVVTGAIWLRSRGKRLIPEGGHDG